MVYKLPMLKFIKMWGLALSGGLKGFFLDVCVSDAITKTVLCSPHDCV